MGKTKAGKGKSISCDWNFAVDDGRQWFGLC